MHVLYMPKKLLHRFIGCTYEYAHHIVVCVTRKLEIICLLIIGETDRENMVDIYLGVLYTSQREYLRCMYAINRNGICFLFLKFYWSYIQCCVNLISGAQQRASVTHIHTFILLRLFSHIAYHRVLSRVPCAI